MGTDRRSGLHFVGGGRVQIPYTLDTPTPWIPYSLPIPYPIPLPIPHGKDLVPGYPTLQKEPETRDTLPPSPERT